MQDKGGKGAKKREQSSFVTIIKHKKRGFSTAGQYNDSVVVNIATRRLSSHPGTTSERMAEIVECMGLGGESIMLRTRNRVMTGKSGK